LRPNRAILDLERQHAAIFELQLAAQKRVRLEDIRVWSSRGHQQLHLAAPHVDVDRLVAFGVIVERLRRIAGRLADERLLNVASFHVSGTVRTKHARAYTEPVRMRTLEFDPSGPALVLVDQTRLPRESVLVRCYDADQVAHAIRSMQVRGAPAIGVSAAYGLALTALAQTTDDRSTFITSLEASARLLAATRPTAVNLRWAVDRVLTHAKDLVNTAGVTEARAGVVALANEMAAEDVAVNRRIGANGLDLVADGANVLTHCNAGALATVDYGTALGVVRAAHEAGKGIHVFVDETRPFLQGARLTAWELQQLGVPMTLITDSMAGHFMNRGRVDLVVVGADRIAANGDVANKIGTYSVAVLAHENGVPFYVAAPLSTIDLSLASGAGIPIEERAPREVTEVLGAPIAPDGVQAAHPAFDVTPARLVTAIITERGVLRAPYAESLARAVRAGDPVVV
jgi:methylthioribose-1-phosphate isomerase